MFSDKAAWPGLLTASALQAFLLSFSFLQEVRAEEAGSQQTSMSASEQDMQGPGVPQSAVHLGEVGQYLWEVYQRAPIKSDRTGDFTWKDPKAANRLGMSMPDYVIGGLHPDFREQLYHAGKAMDAAGIRWTILSAFRDDYRQSLADGYRAGARNSLHGGSARTGGYGHGRAVDVASGDENVEAVWNWFDAHGVKFGLHRPMKVADAGHVQPQGGWRKFAATLRAARTKSVPGKALANAEAKAPAKIKRLVSASR